MSQNSSLMAVACFLAIVFSSMSQIRPATTTTNTVTPEKAGKISNDLLLLKQNFKTPVQPRAGRTRDSQVRSPYSHLQIVGTSVLVTVTAQKEDLLSLEEELKAQGMQVTGRYGRVVTGFVPLSKIESLAKLASVRYVAPCYKPAQNAGSVTSQGDTTMRTFAARQTFGVDGLGVKVGILSDGFDSEKYIYTDPNPDLEPADRQIETGDLPGPSNPYGRLKPVQVLEEGLGLYVDETTGDTIYYPLNNDEGRAMAEIVHDVAPGAEMAFHTAFKGAANFADGIRKLSKAGCTVIVDDVVYLTEPFFQDGIIAQAVDQVKAEGVSYFAAANNFASQSYENTFQPGLANPIDSSLGIPHNFSPAGVPPIYRLPITVQQGIFRPLNLFFQWSQPFLSLSGTGAQTDMDMFLFDESGKMVASAKNNNIQSGDPMEVLNYINDTRSTRFFLMITKVAGPDPGRMKFLQAMFQSDLFADTPLVPGLYSSTLISQANAAGCIAVGGAAYYNTPAYGVNSPVVEPYSAQGGTPILRDAAGKPTYSLRKKPEIVGPTGANVKFLLFSKNIYDDIEQDADQFPNFFGTSAAAPHAAALAALMIEASRKPKGLTPEQVLQALITTTTDMDDPELPGFQAGFDYRTGYGLINAEPAITAVALKPTVVASLKPRAVCSPEPTVSRNWVIANPNAFNVRVMWEIYGTAQKGELILKPGDTPLTTAAIEGNNMLRIRWKNASGFLSISAASGIIPCPRKSGKDVVATLAQEFQLVTLYPNPTTGAFILLYIPSDATPVQVELFHMNGQQVYAHTYTPDLENGTLAIDAPNLSTGLYLLKVRQGQNEKIIKVVKQ